MAASTLTATISDDQLARYATLIYARTGIQISPKKKTLMSNRLRRRMKENGIECYDEYFALISRLNESDKEWDAFLQEVTTHETYLYRDELQWEWFCKEYLPEINRDAKNRKRTKSLRIWSAASSTGDEAYTIASCIAANLVGHQDWKIQIVGTDIGIGALEEARNPTFNARAMRFAPDSIRKRFFTQVDEQLWQPKPILSAWTSFHQHNLMEPLKQPLFDLIFVKNVLIYFDPASKRKVFANIDPMLRPGGALVTGPAEGISDIIHGYDRQKTWLHTKPIRGSQSASPKGLS